MGSKSGSFAGSMGEIRNLAIAFVVESEQPGGRQVYRIELNPEARGCRSRFPWFLDCPQIRPVIVHEMTQTRDRQESPSIELPEG